MQTFAPVSLEVIDDSQQHAGHSGSRPDGESHFTVKIVAEGFRGKSRVEQHRMVNAALAEELKGRVHALAIHASAPAAQADLAFVPLAHDDKRLLSLLQAAGLPTSDLADDGLGFTAIVDGKGDVLACGGLELRGNAALIRSIAAAPAKRASGLGTAITLKLLSEARNRGAVAAYLLTNTAPGFFERLGFAKLGRDKIPAPIAATSQFRGTICASAQPMVHVLKR